MSQDDNLQKILNIQKIISEYMLDFADRIYSCDGIEQYCQLVTAILTFEKLAIEQFREAFSADNIDIEEVIKNLELAATHLTVETLREFHKNLN